MPDNDNVVARWDAFSFDEEITFESIPAGSNISTFHVSIVPEPSDGGVRVLGRMRNGGIGSVTFAGKVYAARLPFSDRVVRLQHIGNTRTVALELTSFTP